MVQMHYTKVAGLGARSAVLAESLVISSSSHWPEVEKTVTEMS